MSLRVDGFSFAAVASGVKREGLDVGLIAADEPVAAAAVLTKNRVRAAPVVLTTERVRSGRAQAVVVNSGCANAATGAAGLKDARDVTSEVAEALGIEEQLVLAASTGVIGARLAVGRITEAVPALVEGLSPDGGEAFSRAILTTDSGPKVATALGRLGRRPVTVVGIAKGAGMICPDMATTLAFVLTDATVRPTTLRLMLKRAADSTFNTISVDGDMSTNDTILVLASGRAGGPLAHGREAARLEEMLTRVLDDLARQIVRDGEGATKLVELDVRGAPTDAAARAVANKIAKSALVKTALHGEDPNWGRILAAAGAAGVRFDPARVMIRIGPVPIVRHGVGLGSEAEQAARTVMRDREIAIVLDLGAGRGRTTVLTCDLTPDYVRINANYRN